MTTLSLPRLALPPGCWIATLFPIPWIWAIYYNTSVSPDRLKGNGVAFILGVIPCPFEEYRTRIPGTNRFPHEQDANNVLTYDNPCLNCGTLFGMVGLHRRELFGMVGCAGPSQKSRS